MRCLACNVVLNDYESTRKDCSDEFVDLCNSCYSHVKYDLPSDKDDCYSVPDKDCEYPYIETV
jgi:hypothetical protein